MTTSKEQPNRIIYELLQKEKAMLGVELQSQTTHGANHHGAYSSTIRTFQVGNMVFSGDYGTLRITAKNLSMFKVIYNDFNLHDDDHR